MNIKKQIGLIAVLGLFTGCLIKQSEENEQNFKKYYDEYDVSGCFMLYDIDANQYIIYNRCQVDSGFTPASTFKICNSIIGIETNVIPDQYFTLKWDSVEYKNLNWNRDTDLRNAFKNSTVWYYQKVATMVGSDTMKLWLEKLEYGNSDISGGITKFWLDGGLRITPRQQVSFIARLIENKLPIQQRTVDIVKEIMIYDKTTQYTMSGKSGWGFQEGKDIGWFVGFLDVEGKNYVFVNCVQGKDIDNKRFATGRIDIVYKILMDLGLINIQDFE